jgi:hypothetical protein
MNDKIRKISNELKKSGVGSDYLVSVDGDKKIYIIGSEGLKNSLRKIIFDAWKSPFGEMKIEGRDFQNNYFCYKEGVNNAPDSFVVISDWEEKLEEIIKSSEQKEKETNERMKKQREENKQPKSGKEGHSIHFRRWDSQGNFVEEKIKELDKPLFEGNLFGGESEKDSSSKITEMDAESRAKKDEKARKQEVKKPDHKNGGGSKKFAIPFIGGGLFLFIVGVVVLVKP